MTVPATPSDAAPSILTLPTGPVSYYDEGVGDPVFLLVHGLPGSARDFRWMSHRLAEHGRVIRVEMPGFGDTPLRTMPHTAVEARGRYVLDCVNALGLTRPILVGHSMGGVVATMTATLAPDRFAGLTLIASPGLRIHKALGRLPRRRLRVLLRVPGAMRLMRSTLARAYEKMGFRGTTHASRVHAMACAVATSIPQHAARLRALRLPLFHAFCEDDRMVEVEVTAHTAATLGGKVHRYPTGGHNPQKHFAVELSAALGAWGASLPNA